MNTIPNTLPLAEFTPLPDTPTFQELLARLFIIVEISAALQTTARQMLTPATTDEIPGLAYLSHAGAERILKEADALVSGIEEFKEAACPLAE